MKIIFKLLIIVTFFLTFSVSALELDIKSKNAIMYNLDRNEIIYQKNDEEKVQIASLTKIMTAIITLDKIHDLDSQIMITNDDLKGLAEQNLVVAGFYSGEAVTYRDLLYGLLLPSGADAASALAHNVSGNEHEFVQLMNEKVKELNIKNTSFTNPIGLDNESNYSTAKDLSVIFNYALSKEEFKNIIMSNEYTTSDGKHTFKSTIRSNSKRYNIDVNYILGGKTGTTDGAGLCLASIARENDINYMLITLGSPYDKKGPHHIEDAKVIYDYFIQNYNNYKIVDKTVKYKTLKTKYLKEDKIDLYPSQDIVKYLPNDYDSNDIKYEYDGVTEITPFTDKKIGKLKIYYKDELLKKEDVLLKVKTHFSLVKFLKKNILYIILSIVLIIIIVKFLKKK